MKTQKNQVSRFLQEQKHDFVEKWKSAVENALPAALRAKYTFTADDFQELFDAYLVDGFIPAAQAQPSGVIEIIKRKINEGFPLSLIGIINACFMSTARSVVRAVYPDSFDARMEYLENLSQRVLDNEILFSQYFEDYVRDLNVQLKEKNEALERRHDLLLEFIDLATRELQAPLWSILGFTAKLQRTYYALLHDDGKHCLNRISANVSEMHQLITDMTAMLLIEEEPMKKVELALADLIEAAAQPVRREIDMEFQVECEAAGISLIGDPKYLPLAFHHVFKNAAQYTKETAAGLVPGRVHISLEKDKDFHLLVEDEGIGIAPDYRELVFKPLERLKEKDVEGSGLGLSFVRRIVSGHKGSVTIEDSRFGGVCVHFIFPLAMIRIKD